MSVFIFGTSVALGYKKLHQEDKAYIRNLSDDQMLCILADGYGSMTDFNKPAEMIVTNIADQIGFLYEKDPAYFLQKPLIHMECAFRQANEYIRAFQIADDEVYNGYSACVTACLFDKSSGRTKVFICHCGTNRVYRLGVKNWETNGSGTENWLVTGDHTEGWEMITRGEMSMENYYYSPLRLKITSDIGHFPVPEIQTRTIVLKNGEMVLMTTKGVHYALRPDSIQKLIYEIEPFDCVNATKRLTEAAYMQNYKDNASAILIAEAELQE